MTRGNGFLVRGAMMAVAAAYLSSLSLAGQPAALEQTATFTAAQAALGRAAYDRDCASCHGANLDDAEFAPPVKGSAFSSNWAGQSIASLLTYLRTTMPSDRPGQLSEVEYTRILAYILQANGVLPGDRELPSDTAMLTGIAIPAYMPSASPVGIARAGDSAARPGADVRNGLDRGSSTPNPELFEVFGPNPLARLTPVTDALLQNPPAEDWLMWRRTYDAHGFSPLTQINRTNVSGLRLAWTYTLATGPNEVTPLVHDGVLFAHSYGEHVHAFDAASGDILWRYDHPLPRDVAPSLQRAIALYEDKLLVPTADGHVIALNTKNGELIWDAVVGEAGQARRRVRGGGPLAAAGRVMIGTTGRAPGGNVIVGLDATTGREMWQFNTIAQPGEPNDSWNGLPVELRNGGSVWTPGSYDASLGLAFFGPAPTYDTAPLLHRVAGQSNDALYTNATVALDPKTGKLVWYFQHLPNDQWDLDWAFERQVITLPINGANRRVVVTMGKEVMLDAVDAATGKYLFSYDSGLQNIIETVDPTTGEKRINPKFIPRGETLSDLCPHAAGAKTWLPGAYDANTTIQFQPVTETCMDLVAVAAGERGSLSTGLRWEIKPRADSDGKFGRIQAVNLRTREAVWIDRQRAPKTTGVLATAGGLVFSGALDRRFTAHDAGTGRVLWETRLNDTSISSPITYSVNGRQYVAITTGTGGASERYFRQLFPDANSPRERASMVWVFELPQAR
jgi:alcohol dehydrogenase (cytochrome c)